MADKILAKPSKRLNTQAIHDNRKRLAQLSFRKNNRVHLDFTVRRTTQVTDNTHSQNRPQRSPK